MQLDSLMELVSIQRVLVDPKFDMQKFEEKNSTLIKIHTVLKQRF